MAAYLIISPVFHDYLSSLQTRQAELLFLGVRLVPEGGRPAGGAQHGRRPALAHAAREELHRAREARRRGGPRTRAVVSRIS